MARAVDGGNDRYDIHLLKGILNKLGYEFYYFPKTDSTMKTIEEHALSGTSGLLVALTDHQTQGIGRQGRKWLDTPGSSLMFSVLFRIPQSGVAVFADLVALTICQVLRSETASPIQVKYPNDLVNKDKKLGGILVKNIYDEKLQYLGTNVGIGLNVHYTEEELDKFPTDYPSSSLDVCKAQSEKSKKSVIARRYDEAIPKIKRLPRSYSVAPNDKELGDNNFKDSFIKRQDLLIKILRALRFLGTEVKVIETNQAAYKNFDNKWRDTSSMLRRKIIILRDDKIVEQGRVINTGLGRGVELQTSKGRKWFSLFESDMKARILN